MTGGEKLNGLKVMKGTTNPETAPKHKIPKTHEKGRRCWCGVALSIYNPNQTCGIHTDPEKKASYGRVR